MNILPATQISQFEQIEGLAWIIIPEFYAPYIPADHNEFFVRKFQTAAAIGEQVNRGVEYYLLQLSAINAGYLALEPHGKRMTLSKLYILNEHRGSGLGTFAMDFMEKRANELGIQFIDLVVNRQNKGTISFYEKWGFRITEDLVHRFENGHSIEDYRMEKSRIQE